MRGLDIRVAFAHARIAAITEPSGDHMELVVMLAEAMGHADYWRGLHLPVMFEDEPILSRAWQRGCDGAEPSEEIEHCPDCIAARGDPCPVHG